MKRRTLGIRDVLRRLRLRPLQPGDEEGERRGVDNVDAMAATTTRGDKADPQGEFPGGVPPGYIKSYDEGRPRN
ncbi:MAG TPA: hypothetical protein VH420_01430 [Gaiellaceae bacterium]|jgi:hypothetical protein